MIVALLFIVVAWPIAIIGLITGIPKFNLDRKMIKMYPSGWVAHFPGKWNPNTGAYIPALGAPEPEPAS